MRETQKKTKIRNTRVCARCGCIGQHGVPCTVMGIIGPVTEGQAGKGE